ncbi:MAG: aminoglycoside phosphotransferase family protein [Pyrinomonadaceae bacterium]
MIQAIEKLREFLRSRNLSGEVKSLTADASTREYFRIDWKGNTAVACMYPEPFEPAEQTYLDVTKLFLAGGLPVAKVLDFEGELGVIIQEDLGDMILRDEIGKSDAAQRKRLRGEAISLIARIQLLTDTAYETNSIASRLKFDTEKLEWELNYFKEHYFGTFLNKPLSDGDDARLSAEFHELAVELESYASVLCHRDFHLANLMIDGKDQMRIIDHQDARIGSPAYDLVSLLLDRITELPSPEWLADKRTYFLDVRRRLGLSKIDEDEFAYEFRLQTIQRCLKAAGTFSFQAAVRGKTHFIPFIKPMFGISIRGATNLGRFPVIREILSRETA